MVHGFDFSKLLTIYYRAYTAGDDDGKAKVVKWFRGEYTTKTEAKNELGVNIIITDDDWFDYIKLFALFLQKAGYSGLLILIDELVNIYKIPNAITRQYNYEKLLTMYNDALQGRARHLGIIMCGTPQCIEDTRRGVYSYEALRSRLAGGPLRARGDGEGFAGAGHPARAADLRGTAGADRKAGGNPRRAVRLHAEAQRSRYGRLYPN